MAQPVPATLDRTGPLSGVRVIETATYISGPLAGMMLSDLGADVIKVEPPRGDPLRRFAQSSSDMSPQFANCNRGKRSVTLDLKRPYEAKTLLGLVADADIFLSNWRPAAAARLGLDDDVLAAENPLLIRLYASGFGLAGPDAAAPAFDSTIQARTGMAVAQGGEHPQLVRSYLYDKFTAQQIAQAALAALYRRTVSGAGCRIDLSMLATGAYVNFPDLMADETFIDEPVAAPALEVIAANRPLPAKDGWLVVSPVSGAQIKRALVAAGIGHAAGQVLSQSGVAVTTTLMTLLEAETPSRTVAAWLEVFEASDVPAAPCLSAQRHLDDPQVQATSLYSVVHTPEYGRVLHVRYPARFSDCDVPEPSPAPAVGEHNHLLAHPSPPRQR